MGGVLSRAEQRADVGHWRHGKDESRLFYFPQNSALLPGMCVGEGGERRCGSQDLGPSGNCGAPGKASVLRITAMWCLWDQTTCLLGPSPHSLVVYLGLSFPICPLRTVILTSWNGQAKSVWKWPKCKTISGDDQMKSRGRHWPTEHSWSMKDLQLKSALGFSDQSSFKCTRDFKVGSTNIPLEVSRWYEKFF